MTTEHVAQNTANQVARQYSKSTKLTVLVYQVSATKFVVALENEMVSGILTGKFKNGHSVA